MVEILPVVDEDDKQTGVSDRETIHREGLLHREVGVYILYQNKVLLQLRKKGRWDHSCAGHLNERETYEDAAVRELKEELGITVRKDELQFLNSVRRKHSMRSGGINNTISKFYLMRISQPVTYVNPEEIEDIEYFGKEEVSQIIKDPCDILTLPCKDMLMNHIVKLL